MKFINDVFSQNAKCFNVWINFGEGNFNWINQYHTKQFSVTIRIDYFGVSSLASETYGV